MKKRIRNKINKGFSLLELILAVTIFSMSAYSLTALLIDSDISTRLNTEKIEALSYAKEGIVAVRSIRDNSWSDLGLGNHGLTNDGSWSFSDTQDTIDDKYTRVVNVSDIATSTKNISVTVTWNLTESRPASVVLNTVLTNWRNN